MSTKLPPIINYPPNFMTLIVWKGALPLPLHFPILPESFMILKKYLINITNTESGGFIDDFGEAPHPITINGTFGYNTKGYIGKKIYSGFGWVKYLEWLVDESHIPNFRGKLPTVQLLSWVSQHFYNVELNELNISQNVTRNMLWVYSLKMTVLGSVTNDRPILDAAMIGASKLVDEGAKYLAEVSSVKL